MPFPRANPRIGALFDSSAVVVTLEGYGDAATLLPAERACTTGFAEARLAEYAAGRACARFGLNALGVSGYPLVSEADRRPRWPGGIVGSITHSARTCGAVVARIETYAAVGIDVERRGRIDRTLWKNLYVASELDRLARATEPDEDTLATIFFSAKESFYKCRYPLTRRWLDFLDVAVELGSAGDSGIGAYVARLVIPDDFTRLDVSHGRYTIDGDCVWTGIAMRR